MKGVSWAFFWLAFSIIGCPCNYSVYFVYDISIENDTLLGGPPAATAALDPAAAGAEAGVSAVATKQFTPGQIAGIVIGCVVGALLLVLLPLLGCWFLCKKAEQQRWSR